MQIIVRMLGPIVTTKCARLQRTKFRASNSRKLKQSLTRHHRVVKGLGICDRVAHVLVQTKQETAK